LSHKIRKLRTEKNHVDYHIEVQSNEKITVTQLEITFKDIVILETEKGNIVMRFYPEAAPKTVTNFKKLVNITFFNGCSFYRAEPDFCLQGGAWPKKESPLPPIPLEYKLPNEKYAVSMARTSDPNSATSEFSIMLINNTFWNGPFHDNSAGYAVFAQVIDGWDVVEAIVKMPAEPKGGLNILTQPVNIIKATLKDEYKVPRDKLLKDTGTKSPLQ